MGRGLMAITIGGYFRMIFQYFDMIFCSRNDIPIIDRVFKLLSGICFCCCSVVNKIIDRVFKLLSGCVNCELLPLPLHLTTVLNSSGYEPNCLISISQFRFQPRHAAQDKKQRKR